MGAIMVGIGVAIVSYAACTFLKPALGYDDSLDVFGVHALGGAWGALASGIFAVTLGSGIESNAQQIMVQLKGIVFVIVFAPIATVVILSRAEGSSSARCASPTRTRSRGSICRSTARAPTAWAAAAWSPRRVWRTAQAVSMSMATRREHLA